MTTYTAIFFLSVLLTATCHNLHKPKGNLIPTIVTAWWPEPNSQQTLTFDSIRTQFLKLFELPFNFIIFGDQNFGKFVSQTRKSNNTQFLELDPTVLTNSWYYKNISQLKNEGQQGTKDSVSSALSYSRIFLMNRAYENDAFNSDQFIWVDGDALNSYQIATILEPKNVNALLLSFNHHFFILTTDKNNEVHAYPNAQKTYFNTKFDTLVTGKLFGAKKDAIPTINLIYEDLLRVVVQFDRNLWSEDAILSLLADRCPFLISYLSANDIKPAQTKRLLPEETGITFESEKATLDYYEWMIGVCEMAIMFVAVLLALEILKFLKKQRSNSLGREPIHQSEMESESNSLNSPHQ